MTSHSGAQADTQTDTQANTPAITPANSQADTQADTAAIAAVLVNHNGWQFTASCARRLAANGLRRERVVVVDNASTDDSASHLRSVLPRALLLANATNLGFAAGCNAGVELALGDGAEAVLLINPDTAHGPDFLQRLARGAGRLADACASPEVFVAGGHRSTWFAGAWWGRVPGTIQHRRAGHGRTSVDVLWACCMLVGREVWRRVGPFEPAFFLFYEDMDWCARAGRAGVRPRVVPEARLWHSPGTSCGPASEATTALRRYHMSRSGVIFDRRWSLVVPHQAGWVRLASAARTAVRLAASGDVAGIDAHLRGWSDGWGTDLASVARKEGA